MAARIAILLHADDRGGAERAARTLAEGLAARGSHVELVLLSGAAGPMLSAGPVPVVALGARRVLTSVRPLAAHLRRERPEAVLSFLTHANLAAVAAVRLSGTSPRLVLAEHVALAQASVAVHRRRELLYPPLIRRLYAHADAVTCLSPALEADTARITGVPPERVAVVPVPVAPGEVRRQAEGPAPHPWLAGGQPPLVLAVGRLERVKAFERLIESLPGLRRELPARLLILGEGRERGRLEALARRLGVESEVAMPGYTPNPYPYIRRAGALALTSLREGLPTVLIEALALGRPVVAVDCVSGPRQILAGGRYGTLVPPGDRDALAGALARALRGPAPVIPDAALAPYDPARVADAYLRLLSLEAAATPDRAAA